MKNMRKKVEFPGSSGVTLAGLLELPSNESKGIALFAHCFTCGKDNVAASRISRALVSHGIGVLRFDFTGLGGSDGDFANTNFSSNVQDLIAATEFLRSHYRAPDVLIGHSLGGTAVLNAAREIEESVGVVTIGSPADADHVVKQFCTDIDRINSQGDAEVDLGGRKFTIKKDFIDDVKNQSGNLGANLNKSLLVFHSPIDTVVSIDEAEKIYRRAKHPKSFISLGDADHLLTRQEDSEYVASMIASWSDRLVGQGPLVNQSESGVGRGEMLVEEQNHQFTRRLVTDHHYWLADEPVEAGGADLGPDPYEHLLAALGSCTSMTIRMYANRKNLPLDDVSVTLSHSRQHAEDCKHCDEQNTYIGLFNRSVSLKGDLTVEQRKRILEIADRCPVHRTLEGKIVIETNAAD